MVGTIDALGRKTGNTCDSLGNVIQSADPEGNVTRFEYDPILSRLTKLTDALGNISLFAYDAKGNLTETADPLGNKTTLAYNAFGQPINMTDSLGNTTTFEYDFFGNLTATIEKWSGKSNNFFVFYYVFKFSRS